MEPDEAAGLGPLALAGGNEFGGGNEAADRRLIAACGDRPAYVVCAAVREAPGPAAAQARRWFATLGCEMTELRVRSRRDALSTATAEAAAAAGLIYVAGGDPGRVVRLLNGSPVWAAMEGAWRRGAALAGSSAGAMALGSWTLVRDRWPGSTTRRPLPALGVVPAVAVLPHFDSFGERWVASARAALPEAVLLGIDERTAAVWEGSWTVRGPGRVVVMRDGSRTVHRDGETIEGLAAALNPGPDPAG
ncbi:MAG: Type 1 glutamine amidotransferase-like domain-containing protein [Candidatus Dormibacteria bacterium]